MEITTKFSKRVKKAQSELKKEGFNLLDGQSPKWRKYVEETDRKDTFYEYRAGTLCLVEIVY